MSNGANPEAGVHDVDSAVAFLTQPEEAKEDETQETVDESEAVEAAADDDAEADEADADEDSADEGDESDTGEDSEAEDDTRYTVKVNGEEFEVTLEELRSGYQMGRDYHQKTARIAEERRSLEAEMQAVQSQRAQLTDALERFAAQGQDKTPDWVKLAEELDPWEYQKQRAEWDRTQQARAVAQHRAQQMRTEDHQKILVSQTQELLRAFPEWKDDKAFSRDRDAMLSVAQSYGFTPDEFYGAVDHRVFKMLRDAMRGKEFEKARPAPNKRVPKRAVKVLKPGVQKSRSQANSDKQGALRENMRRKGTVDSAVEWLLGG